MSKKKKNTMNFGVKINLLTGKLNMQ